MRSRSEVIWDFNAANTKASELDGIADELQTMLDRQSESIENLTSAWVCGSATRYIAKVNQVREQIKNQITNLTNTASTIRECAQRVYDAEMEAIRIAEENERKAAEAARLAAEASNNTYYV